MSRGGEAVDMSFDHKPTDEIETNRITKAGGKVTEDGRVNGGLNLSRYGVRQSNVYRFVFPREVPWRDRNDLIETSVGIVERQNTSLEDIQDEEEVISPATPDIGNLQKLHGHMW